MGRQVEFATNTGASISGHTGPRRGETLNYITDLLSELQTIASISGLKTLSDDIDTVLAKHVLQPVSA